MAPRFQKGLEVKVECYAGGSWCDHPVSVEINGRRLTVREWLPASAEPDRMTFIVVLEDGRRFKLIYNRRDEIWTAEPLAG